MKRPIPEYADRVTDAYPDPSKTSQPVHDQDSTREIVRQVENRTAEQFGSVHRQPPTIERRLSMLGDLRERARAEARKSSDESFDSVYAEGVEAAYAIMHNVEPQPLD